MCVCVCACACVCVRACARTCLCMRACECVRVRQIRPILNTVDLVGVYKCTTKLTLFFIRGAYINTKVFALSQKSELTTQKQVLTSQNIDTKYKPFSSILARAHKIK